MAELDVEVRKPSLRQAKGPRTIALGAVARLRRIDGASREREQSIALGIGTAPKRIVDLDAGLYEIRLMLPSGRVIAQQVELESSVVGHVTFDIDITSNGVLAWQQFSGQVAQPVPERQADAFKSTGLVPPVIANAPFSDSFMQTAGHSQVIDDLSLLMIEVQPTLDDKIIDPERIREVWKLLAQGVRGEVRPADMIKGFFKRVVRPADEDELHDSWQFELGSDHVPGKRPARHYAVVRGADVHELVSLPLPWRIDVQAQRWLGEPIVDLLVDKSAARQGARSRVAVRDSVYGGLLAYMGTGAIGLAGEMIRAGPDLETRALDMLGAKSKSPLGACAAAYVLLATREWTTQASAGELKWQQWVRNLDADPLYNWIPDAAILCARMVLQQAETLKEAREAIPYLHRALRNGLPFYALGYRWLLEAMRFCAKDPLIRSVSADVDRVARYVDVTQTFVALQLSTSE